MRWWQDRLVETHRKLCLQCLWAHTLDFSLTVVITSRNTWLLVTHLPCFSCCFLSFLRNKVAMRQKQLSSWAALCTSSSTHPISQWNLLRNTKCTVWRMSKDDQIFWYDECLSDPEFLKPELVTALIVLLFIAPFWSWQWRWPVWVYQAWWCALSCLAYQGSCLHTERGKNVKIFI